MSTKEKLERAAPRDRGGDVHLRSGPQLREYDTAVAEIVAAGPGQLLDWGCGYGYLSFLLRGQGVDVTSMEWHPTAPEAGEPRRLERYPEIEATFTGDPVLLPYPDASFDTVLSMGVLEHVHDPAASLDEIHRVLRPGGTLYVYKLPNRHSYLEWVARRCGLYWHGQLENDTVYTPDSARALVAAHGFDVTDVRLANLLPLTITARWVHRATRTIWAVNRALARVPGLNRFATNVQLVARRRP